MRKIFKTKKGLIAIIAIFVVIITSITCILSIREYRLNQIQDEKIQELKTYRNEYDETSIVLQNTNKEEAESLANTIGAKLRITKDGSYATLTLTDGRTVSDIYNNNNYRNILEKLSLDTKAKIAEVEEQTSSHLPSSPIGYNANSILDTNYSNQGYLDYLNMQKTWDSYKGNGITVAVIDTGIDTDHPEFAGKISEYSYNATEDKIVKDYLLEDGSYDWSLVEDEQGHGTAVTGVIASNWDGEGIVGIAPNVTIITIKAECDANGSFKRSSDLVFGLYYAIERDVDVVNMSFGSGNNDFAEPARLAVDSDIILVASAGNSGSSMPNYPAADPNVISVGALADDSWELSGYSNFGDTIDLVAPGTVYTCAIGGGYKSMDGTSFSSPIVASAMALLKEKECWNYLEFEYIKNLIYASCYDLGDLGKDFYYGYGALDMSALLLEERGIVTFDMLSDELDDIELPFIRNHTLQYLPDSERNYAVFDGWYYDIHCTDELNWYEDKFVSDLTLYAHWVNEDDGIPFTYETLPDNTIEIRSYTGKRRYITIPDTIEGKEVSSIGEFAFKGQTRLREVNLPKHLNRIRMSAFENCSNLLNIYIPDGVTEIGSFAFKNAARLNAVIFGSNTQITTIGNFAFQNTGLFQFEVPATVTSLNGSAFVGTDRLTQFSVRKGSLTFKAVNGELYNLSETQLVAYPAGKNQENYIVLDSVTTMVMMFPLSKRLFVEALPLDDLIIYMKKYLVLLIYPLIPF